MHSSLIQTLTDMGIEEKHARIYLALLELGQANVDQISKRTGLNRSGLYFVIDVLKKKNLVHQTKIGNRTLFESTPANQLFLSFNEKLDNLAAKMGELNALTNKSSSNSRIRFYDNEEGFRQIWRHILNSGLTEYLVITDARSMLEFVRKNYITSHIIKDKLRKGITSRQLIYPSEYAKDIIAKDHLENRTSKYLPYNHMVTSTIIVFGSNVAFIAPYEENIVFIAESQALSKTQTALFEAIWSAPDVQP